MFPSSPNARAMPDTEEGFRVLPMNEFRGLNDSERVEYLKRATAALKVIHYQLEEALANMLGEASQM